MWNWLKWKLGKLSELDYVDTKNIALGQVIEKIRTKRKQLVARAAELRIERNSRKV